jgi:adenine-specific DNA-methyltransferase
MSTLHLIGKGKVINHYLDVPYRVFEHRYDFNAATGKTDVPTTSGNKINHGDNLEALKSFEAGSNLSQKMESKSNSII